MATHLLYIRPEAMANMKLSRDFSNEQQAEARELALKVAGYSAWRKRAPDGRWQVFWILPR